MARKEHLRELREGTVINRVSKVQEASLAAAIQDVCAALKKKFPGISLHLEPEWRLQAVVESLKSQFPEVDFHYHMNRSSMRPDGGILSMATHDGSRFPILIAEKKNQGTNDLRAREGQKKQAKGNAIERLGKNVIGFRAALLAESIFPFVCFGDGCDFADDSSILDRVTTIAMFGHLNKEYVHTQADRFNRGSFYFREEHWRTGEMMGRCYSIAESAVYYYFSKYGDHSFLPQ